MNQLKPDFNWKRYINNYKDLGDAGITTKIKATSHWINNGRAEGRTYLPLNILQEQPIILQEQPLILQEQPLILQEQPTYQIEPDFNWRRYINNYKDLRDAGITI
jgi:hypothetical protein